MVMWSRADIIVRVWKGGGEGGYRCHLSVKILAICQLSVKFWAVYQLSVNWLLLINYASYLFLFDLNWLKSHIGSHILTNLSPFLCWHHCIKLSWTMSIVGVPYNCRQKWTRIGRPSLKCQPSPRSSPLGRRLWPPRPGNSNRLR